MLGHPDYALPLGQDWLIPLWIATLAVRQKSRMVLFRSAAEILGEFDLPKDGPHYRRLVEGFQRIFTSTIYFGTDSAGGRQEVWDCRGSTSSTGCASGATVRRRRMKTSRARGRTSSI